MAKSLHGQTIWLTGASSGIGLALAKELAPLGCKLILSARNQDALEALKDSFPNAEQHQVLPLDLSQPEQAAAQAEQALQGVSVDILINNAGVSQRSRVLDTDLSVYRKLMEIDYFAVVALTKLVLPSMLARQRGQIVTVSSVAGKIGTKLRSGYAGAKYGVLGFMDSLRAEVANDGIVCTSLLPGFINTPVAHNSLTGDGSALGTADPDNADGMSPEDCAKAMAKAIMAEKDEVVIAQGMSKIAPYLQRLSPRLIRRIMSKR